MNRTSSITNLFTLLLTTAGLGHVMAASETIDVNRNIRNGDRTTVNLKTGGTITRIEVEVKRLNAKHTDTHLTAKYSNGRAVEGGKKLQVDRQTMHVLEWEENGGHREDRKLTITANNGDVHIDEVTVTYKTSSKDEKIWVRKTIGDGEGIPVRIHGGRIARLQVRVRRENIQDSQTYLTAEYSNGTDVDRGEKLQVDRITLYDLEWEPDGERREARHIVLNAHKGEVYIESMSVTYAPD